MKKLNKKQDKNYQFVIKFSKINISKICRELNISRSSIFQGNGKLENYKRIKETIDKELALLYVNYYE